jgi:hypothetical protein
VIILFARFNQRSGKESEQWEPEANARPPGQAFAQGAMSATYPLRSKPIGRSWALDLNPGIESRYGGQVRGKSRGLPTETDILLVLKRWAPHAISEDWDA